MKRELFLAAFLLTSTAFADKEGKDEPRKQTGGSTTISAEAQSEANVSNVLSNDVRAISSPSVDSRSASNNEFRSFAIGGSTAPRVYELPPCWVPRPKMGRGFRFVFGLAEMSPAAERSAECVSDRILEHERELERMEKEIELLAARRQTIMVQMEYEERAAK